MADTIDRASLVRHRGATAWAIGAAVILGAAPAGWLERPPSFSRYRDNAPPRAAGGPQGPPACPTPIIPPLGGVGRPGASQVALRGLALDLAPAVRSPPPGVPPALGDLLARVPRPDYWRDPIDPGCPVTWAHEATHGMTAELSRRGRWVMYLLEGRAIVFSAQPDVTIAQVAASVPAADRGEVFDLYLVKQRKDWNEEPLYLLDEWNAYIHGGIARKQAGLSSRGETLRYAAEMARYCRAMLALIEQRQPSYPDLPLLRDFIAWQGRRLEDLTGVLP